MSDVAAIVLNYNSSDDCLKCVQYLAKQKNINLHILLVDNGSSDEDIHVLQNISSEYDCKLIMSETNRGYSAGNNVGLRYAFSKKIDYALVINPDVELRDDLFVKHMHEKISKDRSIAVIGPDIINAEKNHQNPMRELNFWEELLWPIEIIKNKISKRLPYLGDFQRSNTCEKLSGCCFMISLDFLNSIDFLDENVFLYCEEPILAKQVQKKGLKMFYYKDLKAYHMHHANLKGNLREKMQIFLNSRKYYLKYYSGYSNFKLKILLISRNIQGIVYKII